MEEYIARAWAGVKSKPSVKTFEQLRIEVHTNASALTVMTKTYIARSHFTKPFLL